MTAKIHHAEPALVLASEGPVVLFLHRGEPTVSHIAMFHSQLRATIREHPAGIGLLFVITDASGVPSTEVRAAASATFRELGSKILLLGAAMEGVGFGPAAKRSVFTLVSSSVFGSVRMKVHGTAAEACRWIDAGASSVGLKAPSEMDMLALVTQARAAH